MIWQIIGNMAEPQAHKNIHVAFQQKKYGAAVYIGIYGLSSSYSRERKHCRLFGKITKWKCTTWKLFKTNFKKTVTHFPSKRIIHLNKRFPNVWCLYQSSVGNDHFSITWKFLKFYAISSI